MADKEPLSSSSFDKADSGRTRRSDAGGKHSDPNGRSGDSLKGDSDKESGSWERLTAENADYEEFLSQPATTAPASNARTEADRIIPNFLVANTPAELAPTPGFGGTVVAEDTVVVGSIQVMPDRLVLWGAGVLLGSWNHDNCQIARLTTSRFAIQAEGETITFTADEPSELDQALAAIGANSDPTMLDKPVSQTPLAPPEPGPTLATPTLATPTQATTAPPAPVIAAGPKEPEKSVAVPPTRPEPFVRRPRIKGFAPTPEPEGATTTGTAAVTQAVAGKSPGTEAAEETIADQIVAIARRDGKSIKAHRFLAADIKAMAIKIGVVVAFLVALGGIAYTVIILMGRLGPSASPVTTLALSVSTTTPPPITAPPATATTVAVIDTTTLFATTTIELTERWNQMTRDQFPELMLVNDLTSPFIVILTPNLTMEGVIDPFSGSVTMRATPTGTPEGDGPILTVLGLLIGIADPSLSGTDRAALLAQLGLDIRDPELAGIDGTLDYNGLTYRLVYKQPETILEFVITPTLAATTTTAN